MTVFQRLMTRARGSSKAKEALVEQLARGCEDAEKVCRDQWKNKYRMKVGPAIGYLNHQSSADNYVPLRRFSSSSSLPYPNFTDHSLRVAIGGPAHVFMCKAIVDSM